MLRRRSATVTVTRLCVLAAVPPAGAQTQLLPNLQPLDPWNVYVASTAGGGRELRFGSTAANVGRGPLEIYSEKANDCDANSATTNRFAYQRIFLDADGDGVFNRAVDASSIVRQAGCMVYHSSHHHWHFDAFARYELRSGTAVLRSSTKVSFCVSDSWWFGSGLAGFSSSAYYKNCNRTSTQGISIGWVDEYGPNLDGQSLDITGMAPGSYCLLLRSDPIDLLAETSNSDNARGVVVQLTNTGVTTTCTTCT